MKRLLVMIIVTAIIFILVTGCDTNNVYASPIRNCKYTEWGTDYFDKATIDIHTEVITVDVAWWYDYENNETIVIGTTDGKIYYTHNRDCTLICTESQVR